MSSLVFAYPGDLATPTGGYVYDRRIIKELRAAGWIVDLCPLGDGFPFPSTETLTEAEARLAALPENSDVVIDGLAYGVMDAAVHRLRTRLNITALVHHPLCYETGLDPAVARHLQQSEQRALAAARTIIVTSPATARQLKDGFDLTGREIHIICPGTDRPTDLDAPKLEEAGELVRLLTVGTITPRKGYDLLVEALAALTGQAWTLDVVGDTTRDPDCFADLETRIKQAGLSARIRFHGALPETEIAAFYRRSDVFVLASRYEGYGMAYMEAIAYGLPVIGSGDGAVADTLPKEAAIYCGTEDIEALHAALRRLLTEPAARNQLARGARDAAERLPTWRGAADAFAAAVLHPASAEPGA